MNAATSTPQTTVSFACADVERSLKRYARDLGVSLEHVILASLQMVVEDRAVAQQPLPVETPSICDFEVYQLS